METYDFCLLLVLLVLQNLLQELIRTTAMVNLWTPPLFTFGFTQVLRIDLLTRFLRQTWICSVYKYQKKLFATTQEVNRRAWTAEEVVIPNARVMQMSFDTSDGYRYVNTQIVEDLNLISRAIEGDTYWFELMERFIKVRSLLWCDF